MTLNFKQMKDKFIPPYLYLICIALIVAAWVMLPTFQFRSNIIAIILGFFICILGLLQTKKLSSEFATRKTEIHTFKEPQKLITDGIFRFSRNPIYLSFLVSLAGLSFASQNYLSTGAVAIFFVVSNFYYIPLEEKKLQNKFGDTYINYKRKVRRWI